MAKATDDTTPNPPDPWAVLDRLATALERAKSSPAAADTEVMARLTQALERVSEAQVSGARIIADETRRVNRPENPLPTGVSVFNRRGTRLDDSVGGPRKPPLKCPMFIPWLVEWECCTREEVELLNLLQQGEYTVTRNDKSKIKVAVTVEMALDGTRPSRLLMRNTAPDGSSGTAFKVDHHLVPALSDMLRQILRQHDPKIRAQAASVMSDEEEEALIEAGELTVSV